MVPTNAQPVSGVTASPRARVHGAIARAAEATGVGFDYLYHQARVESSLNPDARARTSSATGLFQFIDQTWLATVERHGADHGLGWAAAAITRGANGRYQVADPATRAAILDLRRQPEAASAMAGAFAADNRAYLEARIGRAAQPVDLYLAHFLGPAGAATFLSAHDRNPGAAAAAILPAAARANHSIFYARDGSARSLGAIRERFAARFGDAAPPAAGPVGGAGGNDWGLPTTLALTRPAPADQRAALTIEGATRASDQYARIALLTLMQLGEA